MRRLSARYLFAIVAAVAAGIAASYLLPGPLPELTRAELLDEVRAGHVHRIAIEDQEVIDPTEIFRLIWENRGRLKLDVPAYTCLERAPVPAHRAGGRSAVRETVAECVQYLAIEASEFRDYRLRKPDGMADTQTVVLRGGSTLVLDEYGMLKYEMHNRLPQGKDPVAQAAAQEQARLRVGTGLLRQLVDRRAAVRAAPAPRVRRFGSPPGGVVTWPRHRATSASVRTTSGSATASW